jgi:hypothetical protein
MKRLPITWKRLVKEGETCKRCGSTYEQAVSALAKLETSLRPLGIQPVLETLALDERAFRAEPSESNRIWIAGKPIEEWLGASVGKSPCCSVCGDLPCRTLETGGNTFETIPADLIVKAALIAATQMIGSSTPDTAAAPCCTTACK